MAVVVVVVLVLAVLGATATGDPGSGSAGLLGFTMGDPGRGFAWTGVVDGAVVGRLHVRLTAARVVGGRLHGTFHWAVDAGARSFVSELTGVVDLSTGVMAVEGRIVDGWRRGASVRVHGVLDDAATSTFRGTVRLGSRTEGVPPMSGWGGRS